MNQHDTNYRFLLPQIQKTPVGNQGEMARYIPYRLEADVNEESILQELNAQPHMAQLVRYLDPKRKLYLLESTSMEVLELAAEYIGTYHRLVNRFNNCYDSVHDGEDDEDETADWHKGDAAPREVDFAKWMPYLQAWNVNQFYSSEQDIGFGDRMYLPDHQAQSRPWWTLSLEAPVAVTTAQQDDMGEAWVSGGLCELPKLVRNLSERSLIVLMCLRSSEMETEGFPYGFDLDDDPFGFSGKRFTMEDVSFELETEVIRLEKPKPNSPYKKNVLCQLAREQNAPLARSSDAGRILSIVEDRRGNTDNVTLAKVVSNALMRRKGEGPLAMRDFSYLSTLFISRKKPQKGKRSMELVGQTAVRTQLEQIVAGMAFQARRKRLGLSTGEIHYTFAFLGAPGTGKTTWARWLGEEMRKRSLLQNTETICINAAELKAKYVGHTASRVHALFEQYGIIILDEAYSLAGGEDGDCFGAEALSQLCVELENHSGDRLVVFAGYGGASDPSDNRMLHFLQSNPGISSRIAFKIHFQNFQAPELVEVLHTMLTFEDYHLPKEADQRVERFFQGRLNRRAFGNCREVRNLADRIKLRAAARLVEVKNCTKEMASQVQLEDVEAAMDEMTQEFLGLDKNEGRSIGFS